MLKNRIKLLSILLLITVQVIAQIQSADLDSFIVKRMKEKKIPGLAMAIIKRGKVVKKQAYGHAVLGHDVPAKIETVYELASITKQFIAVGTLILVQDGLLNLDKPLSTYLDDLPPQWRDLTTRQLLSHTAGLAPMSMEWKSLKTNGWPKLVTKEMMWNAALRDSVYNKPGEAFLYHNTGYFLAVLVIEKITGIDHRQFFRDRIFDPLGMSHTFFEDQIRITPNLAQGYTLKDKRLVKIWRVGQEEIGGGQGLYSDINDMIQWNAALNNHQILEPAIQQEMFSRVTLNNGQNFRYGLGWWLPERNNIRYRYHNGITGPEIIKIPSLGIDVIVLTNLGQGDYDQVQHWGLAHEIVGQFLIQDFQHNPTAISANIEKMRKYCGSYSYGEGGIFHIELTDHRLHLSDEMGRAEMVLTADNTLTLVDDPVIFKFVSKDLIQIMEETWMDDWGTRIKN